MRPNDPINVKTVVEKKQRCTDVSGLAKQVLPGYQLPVGDQSADWSVSGLLTNWDNLRHSQVREFAVGTLILWIQKHITQMYNNSIFDL